MFLKLILMPLICQEKGKLRSLAVKLGGLSSSIPTPTLMEYQQI